MKKLFVILALVLSLVVCAAFAEEGTTTTTVSITFRNDITFGMGEDEVVAAETETLHIPDYGGNMNEHVSILTTDDFEMADGITGSIQYLFWDGALFAVLNSMDDNAIYDDYLQLQYENYGDPEVMSAQGTAEWAERMTGNLPEVDGDQYVWSFDNNISLTVLPFGDGFIFLWIDAN